MNAGHWSALPKGVAARSPLAPTFTFTLANNKPPHTASYVHLTLTTAHTYISTKPPTSIFLLLAYTLAPTQTAHYLFCLIHPPLTAHHRHPHEASAEARLRSGRDREVRCQLKHSCRLTDFKPASRAFRFPRRSSADVVPKTCLT